jgi:5-methyltetrahydrofolate corrinoid/iron sulfur protein methyltransferase
MILAADNLHVVNTSVSKAVEELDPEPIQSLVERCIGAGAQAIDINSGPLPRQPEKRFAFLVETVQAVTDRPLLLDTTNPAALRAGLEICRRRPIINGFSLEPARIERILPLACSYDADIIGYLLDAHSRVPVQEQDMMTLAVSLFETAVKSGLDPRRLIIDPVIAPLSWESGAAHNRAVLSVIRSLPDLLGLPVRTIAGLSNLASGPIPRQQKIFLEQTFLPMLAAAGLDMVLLNIFNTPSVQTAKACDALLGDGVFAWAAAAQSPE